MINFEYVTYSLGIITIYWMIIFAVSRNTSGEGWLVTTMGTEFVDLARRGDIWAYCISAISFTIKFVLLAFFLTNFKAIKKFLFKLKSGR